MHPRAVRALNLLLGVIDTDADGGDLELHCDQAEAALCHHEEVAVRSGRMLAQMSVVSGCDCATPSEELAAQGLTSEEIASALCDGFPVRRVTAEYAVAVLRQALNEPATVKSLSDADIVEYARQSIAGPGGDL